MGNLLEKIIDPMTIMIRVVGLMVGYFLFLWEFSRISLFFLEYPPRVLGGFMWMLESSLQLVIVRYYFLIRLLQ